MSNVATAKRGPYAGTQRRRQEITAAVIELVEDLGHDAVTTAGVAERAGTSEATVLYHFPSKDHLLLSALERADELEVDKLGVPAEEVELDLESLRRSAAALSRPDNLARLAAALRGSAATPGHPAEAYFQQRTRRALSIYTRFIQRRQRDGYAHPSLDAAFLAVQLLALYDGLTALQLVQPTADFGALLVDGYRRMAGENWMSAARTVVDAFDL